MSHDHEHGGEPLPGLPELMPAGEKILWQGSPGWKALATHAFHVYWLAAYFGVFIVARGAAAAADGKGLLNSVLASLMVSPLAAVCIGLVVLFSWLTARTTVYTITSQRVVMRFGIALPMTFNLPFRRLTAVDMKVHPQGDGEIALTLGGPKPLGYLPLWPHVRPWRISRASPMLRGVARGDEVAKLLADAMSATWPRPRQDQPAAAPELPAAPQGGGVPRRILSAGAVLLLFSLGVTYAARATNFGTSRTPASLSVEQVDLRFEDRPDGSVKVFEAATGREISSVPPGTNGFIRGVLRGMARGRRLESMGPGAFRLSRWSDGRLSIEDPATGRVVDLGAFGPTNSGAFAQLLLAARKS